MSKNKTDIKRYITHIIRILSLPVILFTYLSALPGTVNAAEFVPVDLGDMSYFPDNDELFDGYVIQAFYGDYGIMPIAIDPNALNAAERDIYDRMVPVIKNIAAGRTTSTEINMDVSSLGITHSNNQIVGITPGKIIRALMANYPYDMYWYDKTTGCFMSFTKSGNSISSIVFKYSVASEFQGSAYATNAGKCSATTTAVRNAQNIVRRYADSSDYDKLVGYKNEILAAVEYNYSAAGNSSTPYGNPWQLIWVFDGDSSTNVVCEGYSKAFQYLCDMSSFNSDIVCYSVSGKMNGGNHMWNIVTIDGKNYLVDVTNCDGNNDPNGLFLTGASPISGGYKVMVGGTAVNYVYSDDQYSMFGSALNLSGTNLDPSSMTSSGGNTSGGGSNTNGGGNTNGGSHSLPNTAADDGSIIHLALFFSMAAVSAVTYCLKRRYA